jgi:hypothetical protein
MTISEKNSNITLHQNPSSGSRVVPGGQTDMKLIVSFRNFANAPKKSMKLIIHLRPFVREQIYSYS